MSKTVPLRCEDMKIKHLVMLILPAICAIATAVHAETAAQHQARLVWWRTARFGMFIHWGPVSLTGLEPSWLRANSATPIARTMVRPRSRCMTTFTKALTQPISTPAIADIAKSAGMKYMVFTARHGDGFLLWDSKVDGYNISMLHRFIAIFARSSPGRRTNRMKKSAGIFHRWIGVILTAARLIMIVLSKKTRPNCASCFPTTQDSVFSGLIRRTSGHVDPAVTYPLVRGLQPQILINNRLEMSTQEQ